MLVQVRIVPSRREGEEFRRSAARSLALQALLITINFPRIDALSGPER